MFREVACLLGERIRLRFRHLIELFSTSALEGNLVPIAIDKIWAFMGKADVGKFVSALHGTPAVSSHFS